MTTEANVIEAAARKTFGDDYAGLGMVDGELVVFTAGMVPDNLPADLEGVPIRTVR